MTETLHRVGQVVWRELICPDVSVARRFYGGLFGWRFEDAQSKTKTVTGEARSIPYTMVRNGDAFVGGMLSLLPPPDGPPPHWMVYVSVVNVDGALHAALEHGGKHIHGPADIEGTGRFVIFADPSGAALTAFRSNVGDGSAPAPAPGNFSLETLVTTDAKRAVNFYDHVFGWEKLDSGPASALVGVGGSPVASIHEAKVPRASFYSHVIVSELETTRNRIEPLGGKVIEPEIRVPGVGRVALFTDPGGAELMLFERSA